MTFRYNPFWFDETGQPTENLELVLTSLKIKLTSKLSGLFSAFNPESCSYYVVGSNAKGYWRSQEDLDKIIEFTSRISNGHALREDELAYLSTYYSEKEISDYFFNPRHMYYLNPGRMNVSDLDLKVKGIPIDGRRIKKMYDLYDLEVKELKKNDSWSGMIHVFYNQLITPPYFSLTEKKWTTPDF